MSQEQLSLKAAREQGVARKQWGPYLSERQWGTVREDYSENGDAWNFFTHDQARLCAYRWGEDGLAGISDDQQRLCFALALWNGKDPILKERLFGLTNSEGKQGTKVAAHYRVNVGAGQTKVIHLRLSKASPDQKSKPFGKQFDEVFADRLREADVHKSVTPPTVSEDAANVMCEALAGMLWSKQFFFFDGDNWLDEHHSNPLHSGFQDSRNSEWFHMLNKDIISMPDKWEYPWYAAWDLVFHTLPLAIVDPDFAKQQMELMLRGVYLIPAARSPRTSGTSAT